MIRPFTCMRTLALAVSLLTATAALAEEDKDTVVTIPATGHLAIKPTRNFTGPATVIASNFYGSGNASSPGLKFTNVQLDTEIISVSSGSSTAYILTAAPGTYTLTYTDRTATKNFTNTAARWADEPGTVFFKAGYRIYKFVNQPGHVGFEVDAKYASEGYQHADMGEGEHLYMPLNPTGTGALSRIAATLDTTIDALTFIPWSDKWDCPEPNTSAGISTVKGDGRGVTDGAIYNMQGQRLAQPQRGINIQNGKKYIVK